MTGYFVFVTLMSVVGVCFTAKDKFNYWSMAYFLLSVVSFIMAVANLRYGGIEWLSVEEYKLVQVARATKGVNK